MNNNSLIVSELFYSIQGESTFAGMPCCFIRLSNCNLRCAYCDSAYTWEEPGTPHTIDDILLWLDQYPDIIIEITGGEPLLQDNIHGLILRLLERGRTVLLETNGSLSIVRVAKQVVIIMDIKCPDSGMADRMEQGNIEILAKRNEQGCRDEIKFVIGSERDFHWALEKIATYQLEKIATLLFSPIIDLFPPEKLARLIMHHQAPVRLQPQLHRYIWPHITRGV